MFNEGYEFGGAIYIQTPQRNNPTRRNQQSISANSHTIENSEFDKNWAHAAGGSVFVGCLDSLPIPQVPNCANDSAHLFIKDSHFTQSNNLTFTNHTRNRSFGGAVATYIGTDIVNSKFDTNIAFLGGGVFFYGASGTLTNVNFEGNTANISGKAIYAVNAKLVLDNCTVKDTLKVDHNNKNRALLGSRYQIAFYSTQLTFRGVLAQLFKQGIDPVEIALIDVQTDFPHPNSPFGDPEFNIENTTFMCPVNYRTVVRALEKFHSVCSNTTSNGGCQFTRAFSLVCQRSDSNRYIAGPGTFMVNRFSPTEKPYVFKFIHTHNCPVPGGKCVQELQAVPGYWGTFKSKESEEVEFIQCPGSTCCTDDSNCLSFDSCNSNRKGVLCSQCDTNYYEGLIVRDCVENVQCGKVLTSLIVVFAILSVFGIVGVVVRFDVEEVISSNFSYCMEKIKCNCCNNNNRNTNRSYVTPGRDTYNANISAPRVLNFYCFWISSEKNVHACHNGTSTDTDTTAESSLSMYVLILYYMLQDFSLFNMHLSHCSNHWKFFDSDKSSTSDPFWGYPVRIFTLVITSVTTRIGVPCFMLTFGTALPKFGMKMLCYAGVYVVFIIWYNVFYYRSKMDQRTLRLRVFYLLIKFHLFIFKDVSEFVISLLDCVSIQGTKYLHIDAIYTCHEWHIALVCIYLIFFVLPFPVIIMFAPSVIAKRKVKFWWMFLLAMWIPPFGLIWCLCNCRTTNEQTPPLPAQPTSSRLQSISGGEQVTFAPANTAGSTSTDDVDSEATGKKIAESLQGYFQTMNIGWGSTNFQTITEDMRKKSCGLTWLGVILLFRLVMVFFSVLIHAVDIGALLLCVIILIRFFLHLMVKPYSTFGLNFCYATTLFFLLVLSVCTFGLSLIEKCEYEYCATDELIAAMSITSDVLTLYLPGLLGIIVLVVLIPFILIHLFQLSFFYCLILSPIYWCCRKICASRRGVSNNPNEPRPQRA